jgi:cyclic beta-1,2-glucan synthetase
MINPLTRARTPEEVATYQVEPYVVAAEVYTAEGHLGRGGWTWYTGSASWMYRVGLETILGFVKRGDTLYVEPRMPAAWASSPSNTGTGPASTPSWCGGTGGRRTARAG